MWPWRFALWDATVPICQGDGVEEDGVRWDVVRSDLCHALGEVIHNGALTRDLHAAKAPHFSATFIVIFSDSSDIQ